MKVAIDISRLQSGHKARGTGVYIRELIAAFEKTDRKLQCSVIHPGQGVPNDADITHYPYFDPFLLTLPLTKPKPTVVTVHDLIPLVFPDKFPKGIRGWMKWQIQKKSLAGCRRIITDSQASKSDIHRIIKYGPERIDVVPLAPSPVYHPVKEKSVLRKVRKKYLLPSSFILYVGDVNWNKNIPGLLEAYSLFINKSSLRPPLVLIGSAFLNNSVQEVIEINRRIESLGIKTSIIRPGYVPDKDLAALYSQAVCLIHPSYYEGFGFPVLEAMASGCPVLTSKASSLAEIAGPAATFDPDNIEEMASGFSAVVTLTKNQKSKVILDGLAWAKRFTWQKVATATIESYRKALL